MGFFKKQLLSETRPSPARDLLLEHRAMSRVEAEARILITTLNGETYQGVLRNMNGEAIAAYVEADLEPANRVTLSYCREKIDEQFEVQAIVRRRNGFLYVFDTGLVDVMDQGNWC